MLSLAVRSNGNTKNYWPPIALPISMGFVRFKTTFLPTEPEPSVTEKDILAAIYSEELIQSNINISLDLHTVAILGNVPTLFQKKLVEKLFVVYQV
jgi:hypothetical protein